MAKIKLNSKREEISSEEINSRKDFNQLITNYKKIKKPLYNNPYFLSLITISVIIGSILIINKPKQVKDSPLASKTDSINTEQEQSPFVSPPFENIKVPVVHFSFKAEKGGIFKLKTGSEIIIPKNAFMDKNNQPVSGDIKIHYREFRDPIDMLVSGIPMSYDSAGLKLQLESAGMFDITGEQNGNAVFLSKDITVKLASASPSSDYNQYYLDTVARAWKYLGRDKMETKSKIKKQVTNTEVEFYNSNKNENIDNSFITSITNEKPLSAVEKFKIQEPVKPKKSSIKNHQFDIDVLPNEFPELSEYKGLKFEVGPENKNFNETLFNIVWDDVSLAYNTPGKNYKTTFKKGKEKLEFIVYPVYLNNDSAKTMKLYQQKFEVYNKGLQERIEKEEQEQLAIEKERKKLEQERKEIIELRKKSDKAFMKSNGNVNDYNIKRIFTISKFGIYNSDFPSYYPNRIVLAAAFSIDGKPVNPSVVYMLDKDKNTLFSHYSNFSKFFYNPTSKHRLFTVLPDNKIGTFEYEDFAGLKKINGKYNFEMKNNNLQYSTMDELKNLLLTY